MTALTITDLGPSAELDREAMTAVRGGFNAAMLGGQSAPQTIGGGFGFFSPVTAVNTPVNVPIAIQLDMDSVFDINTSIANVIGSMNTGIAS
jgi:hypothetical protein